VCCGPTVRTVVLIPSRTCMQPHSSLIACNDWLKLHPSNRAATVTAFERQRAKLGSHRGLRASSRTHRPYQPEMSQQRSTTVRLRTSLFEEAAAIVSEEYDRDIALDEIARRVASSRRQLQRAYAEIGHTTFRTHLTAVRMDAAAQLLARAPLTVREVAHRVGYRQPAQFAKAFRRHHGVSPSSYRQRRRLIDGQAPIRAAA
jgi:AraC family transcriptional regulator, regulatory protein of adaptative response / methylphosphotriester-DNA alkyltransferase methyltransferase